MKYTLAALLAGTLVCVHCNTPPKVTSPAQPHGQVPEWLFRTLQRQLDNPSVLEPEDISYGYVWLKAGRRPQVVASARIDRLNGVLALFEDTGAGYTEVYTKKEPVYELSVTGHRRQLVSFVSGLGGTGVQHNFYYLVGYTGSQYAELWRGVAVAFLFTGPLPYTYTTRAFIPPEPCGLTRVRATSCTQKPPFVTTSTSLSPICPRVKQWKPGYSGWTRKRIELLIQPY